AANHRRGSGRYSGAHARLLAAQYSGAEKRRLNVAYEARARQHAANRDVELARSTRLSRARLVTFLVAAATLIWTLASGADAIRLTAAGVLFAVFGVLVFWHARIEERAAWHDALRTANIHAAARHE